MNTNNVGLAVMELGGVALVFYFLLRFIRDFIISLAWKTARRKKVAQLMNGSASYYQKSSRRRKGIQGRKIWPWKRYDKRFPEWERWNGKQTDYVGGMFHKIGIGGFRAVYCMDYYPKNKYPDSGLSAEKVRAADCAGG